MEIKPPQSYFYRRLVIIGEHASSNSLLFFCHPMYIMTYMRDGQDEWVVTHVYTNLAGIKFILRTYTLMTKSWKLLTNYLALQSGSMYHMLEWPMYVL